ncbi:MAG: hypothetical protein ACYC46_14220 [Acidobacteriaceae bacterium]
MVITLRPILGRNRLHICFHEQMELMEVAMTDRVSSLSLITLKQFGFMLTGRSPLRLLSCLLAIALIHATASPVSAQETRVLLKDARALVREVNLSPGQAYMLPKNQLGVVWVALTPLIFSQTTHGQQIQKQVASGDAETDNADERSSFRTKDGQPGRLIVVTPKVIQQELTVSPFVIENSLEDASDRNATLLVAITDCRFRDIRNRGDESEWIPGRPDIVMMKSGEVRWIRPGIHHFKNLGPTTAKLVSIEW